MVGSHFVAALGVVVQILVKHFHEQTDIGVGGLNGHIGNLQALLQALPHSLALSSSFLPGRPEQMGASAHCSALHRLLEQLRPVLTNLLRDVVVVIFLQANQLGHRPNHYRDAIGLLPAVGNLLLKCDQGLGQELVANGLESPLDGKIRVGIRRVSSIGSREPQSQACVRVGGLEAIGQGLVNKAKHPLQRHLRRRHVLPSSHGDLPGLDQRHQLDGSAHHTDQCLSHAGISAVAEGLAGGLQALVDHVGVVGLDDMDDLRDLLLLPDEFLVVHEVLGRDPAHILHDRLDEAQKFSQLVGVLNNVVGLQHCIHHPNSNLLLSGNGQELDQGGEVLHVQDLPSQGLDRGGQQGDNNIHRSVVVHLVAGVGISKSLGEQLDGGFQNSIHILGVAVIHCQGEVQKFTLKLQ
mmetsp:Transcript_33810/g.73925  ORF Transcript_33810/g.73925 Transcript_33810/m.73925 type:complete len:408 (-) Transcript_33810:188-1411(-)